MLVGIPKEVKDCEFRIGATPTMVAALVKAGHTVLVESDGGAHIGFSNEDYSKAGASIVDSVWEAELIIKVKEPQESEYPLMREGQIIFGYFHFATNPPLVEALKGAKVTAIAYEEVRDEQGRLPLLTPMSELAGRVAVQVGAVSLHMGVGGKGVLLGGVPGVHPGEVVIVGGGVVGTQAARVAIGLGAHVTLFDTNLDRLRQLDDLFDGRLETQFSTPEDLAKALPHADLVVGAVLIPGKSAPKLISREMVKTMEPGSVIVDVAIDQGGCCETSRPTTHSDPTYTDEGVVHYCVTNIPGAYARTATAALTHATQPYAIALANEGPACSLTRSGVANLSIR